MKFLPLMLALSACATTVSVVDRDTETPLAKAALVDLLTGKTMYIQVPPGGPGGPDGGVAPFLFSESGAAAALLPTGTTLTGTWRLLEDRYCVDWSNGPKNSCSGLMGSDGDYTVIDVDTGDVRGQVVEIRPGNPEGL